VSPLDRLQRVVLTLIGAALVLGTIAFGVLRLYTKS
jgi:hypothetical protein